ncbi:MAG: FAD-binding oxidoreductase [Firmicutes bacterium]|nr:FAD-binding oxidoreductase [Bacillota bacterium]
MKLQSFMFDMILSELEDAVGEENVSTRQIDKLTHGVDYFWLPRMWADCGEELPQADVIVSPENTQQVSAVLKIANYYKIPVTVWGGGAGSQGGALPMTGGILLDTKRMNKVLEYNPQSMYMRAQAGAIWQHLEWYANQRGHSTMHFPGSVNCSTLGGFLAHRGIGVLSTKYGKIDDMCLSMEVVLPNGEIINTLPVPKHAAGPDLNQIFIGSEGTLGVITEANIRIYELPQRRIFRAFLFKDLSSGIAAGREILTKIKPSVMRLYDEAETASIIKKVLGISKPGVFMNFALEGLAEVVAIEERILLQICEKYGAEDMGSDYGEKWWQKRIDFFYPGHIMDLPQMFGTMDTIATYSNIEKVYWAMKEAIETNFPMARFIAHFSHWYEWGVMLYDRFIVDNPPQDPKEALRLHNQIWNTGVRAALANGGVINDHHGIGLKLSRLMKEQYGPAMQVFAGLKKALDPNGIMNPYKLGL